MKSCWYCNFRESERKRIIYEDGKACTFLSDHGMTRGHSITFFKEHKVTASMKSRDMEYFGEIVATIARALRGLLHADHINVMQYGEDNDDWHIITELLPIYEKHIEKKGFAYFIPPRKKTESFSELISLASEIRGYLENRV